MGRTGRAISSQPEHSQRQGSTQDEMYAPYLGQLAKLVFLSSSVHQLTVSVLSSIPYVIGQARPILPSSWKPTSIKRLSVSSHVSDPCLSVVSRVVPDIYLCTQESLCNSNAEALKCCKSVCIVMGNPVGSARGMHAKGKKQKGQIPHFPVISG